MPGVKFDIGDSDKVEEWFNKGVEKAAERAVTATAARVVNHIQTEIIPRLSPPPVDRGFYRAAWQFRPGKQGVSAEVYNTAAHAVFIEYGVRAENVKVGGPMITGLTGWVQRKLRPGAKMKKKGTTTKKAPRRKSLGAQIRAIIKKLVRQLTKFIQKTEKPTPSGSKPNEAPTGYTEKQARRIAWAIALNMKRRGIFDNGKGFHVLTKAATKVQSFFDKELRREIKREFK